MRNDTPYLCCYCWRVPCVCVDACTSNNTAVPLTEQESSILNKALASNGTRPINKLPEVN